MTQPYPAPEADTQRAHLRYVRRDRWPSRHLGPRGPRVPPLRHRWIGTRVGTGRISRRRSLLRRERRPDHVAAPHRAPRDRGVIGLPYLLRPPGPPPPARAAHLLLAVVTAYGMPFLPDAILGPQRRCRRRTHLHQQLVADHLRIAPTSRRGWPAPLKHLWSLAIEEQFYILWPLVLGVALKKLGRDRAPWAMVGRRACFRRRDGAALHGRGTTRTSTPATPTSACRGCCSARPRVLVDTTPRPRDDWQVHTRDARPRRCRRSLPVVVVVPRDARL